VLLVAVVDDDGVRPSLQVDVAFLRHWAVDAAVLHDELARDEHVRRIVRLRLEMVAPERRRYEEAGELVRVVIPFVDLVNGLVHLRLDRPIGAPAMEEVLVVVVVETPIFSSEKPSVSF
jgi:hypothetical protein